MVRQNRSAVYGHLDLMIIAVQYIRLLVQLEYQERVYFFFDLAAKVVIAGRYVVVVYFFGCLLFAQQFAYFAYRQNREQQNKNKQYGKQFFHYEQSKTKIGTFLQIRGKGIVNCNTMVYNRANPRLRLHCHRVPYRVLCCR